MEAADCLAPDVHIGRPGCRPQLPVVFLHGLGGFSQLLGLPYARSWRRVARAEGITLLTPRTRSANHISLRAEQAAKYLHTRLPQGRFHLIGHSMGGLDARYLVSCMGLGDRVPAVVTLGTPHHGTPLLGEIFRRLPRMGEELDFQVALEDLSEPRVREFNQAVPDHPQVRYFSWAGRVRWWQLPPFFWHISRPLERRCGPTDGLVAEGSARWGTYMGGVPLNHLGLVGWQFLPWGCVRGWQDHLCRWVFDVLGRVEAADQAKR